MEADDWGGGDNNALNIGTSAADGKAGEEEKLRRDAAVANSTAATLC